MEILFLSSIFILMVVAFAPARRDGDDSLGAFNNTRLIAFALLFAFLAYSLGVK